MNEKLTNNIKTAVTKKQIKTINWIGRELSMKIPSPKDKNEASKFISQYIQLAHDHKTNRIFNRIRKK